MGYSDEGSFMICYGVEKPESEGGKNMVDAKEMASDDKIEYRNMGIRRY